MTNRKFYRSIAALTAAVIFTLTTACGAVEDQADSDMAVVPAQTTASAAEEPDTSAAETESKEAPQPDDRAEPNKDDPQPDEELKELDEAFIADTAQFSIELFKAAAADDIAAGKNVLVSPESVLMALGMTANGASGDTLANMQKTFFGSSELDAFNENMKQLRLRAVGSKEEEKVIFNIANSIWIKDIGGFEVEQSFLDTAEKYFGAQAFVRPFNQSTADEINDWVNENTNEMIPELFDKLDESMTMCLINAIAFEGKWEKEYEDADIDEDGIFTNAAGEEQTAAMLNSAEKIYLSDDSAQGFVKYYSGNEYAFMAILPNEGISVSDYIDAMTADSFSELYNNREHRTVLAKIPEFRSEYDINLNAPLKSMGMQLPFSPDTADFSKMTNTSQYISNVVHKTFIELDREGTRAAAATAVTMTNEAVAEVEEPIEVYLDRPFIYAIIDTENGMPVFIGAVNSIA